MLANKDNNKALVLLRQFSREEYAKLMEWSSVIYNQMVTGFINESYRTLRKAMNHIEVERRYFKQVKRIGTMGISKLSDKDALEKSLYLFQGNDFATDILHSVKPVSYTHLESIAPVTNPRKRRLQTGSANS